jgi:hypothetical protein
MAIVGVNSLLNQYTPTFYIKNIVDGQILMYDAVRKAFVNVDAGGGSGVITRLGQLLDVDESVDNPLSLQNGQALVYNLSTNLWENKFVDYNTLLNKPTNSDYSFVQLSDTAKPSLPNGYVLWNPAGTELIYSATIPSSSISDLATVAITGNYNDLIDLPTINDLLPSQTGKAGNVLSTDGTNVFWQVIPGTGTVTSVNVVGGTGIQVSGSPIVTSGTITVGLQNTGVSPGTYTNATVQVDSTGRVTSASDGVDTGTEIVVFRYSSGSAGTFNIPGAVISQTSGVTANIIDPNNCIVEYTFITKKNVPKSIMTYGQVYATNKFNIRDVTSLPAANSLVIGGGSDPNNPTILTSFGPTNKITLQTRMGDVGASAGVGQRAYLMIIFGF